MPVITPKKPSAKAQARIVALREFLDPLVDEHKTAAFRDNDPISIPHRYTADPRTCEAVAFFTTLLSYGQRKKIIETVGGVMETLGPQPLDFIEAFEPKRDGKLFKNFVYRFNKGEDIVFLLSRLQWVYREYPSLEALFMEGQAAYPGKRKQAMADFVDRFLGPKPLETYGMKFMVPHPARGGACKRLHMFLRWVVRQDTPGPNAVDLGLWREALTPGDLMIPLDTHVTHMNRIFGFSERSGNTWETAEEITDVLRQLCPEDPVKYDFALMGLSLSEPDKDRLAARLPRSLSARSRV